jgi:hypothetical protein
LRKGFSSELKSVSSTIKDVLLENIGKMAILQMDTGVNMEGIVNKVGNILVHTLEYFRRGFLRWRGPH